MDDEVVTAAFMMITKDTVICNRAYDVGVVISEPEERPIRYGCPYCRAEFKKKDLLFRFDNGGKWMHTQCAAKITAELAELLVTAVKDPDAFFKRHKLLEAL